MKRTKLIAMAFLFFSIMIINIVFNRNFVSCCVIGILSGIGFGRVLAILKQ